MKVITKYVTDGGEEFNTKHEAEAQEFIEKMVSSLNDKLEVETLTTEELCRWFVNYVSC